MGKRGNSTRGRGLAGLVAALWALACLSGPAIQARATDQARGGKAKAATESGNHEEQLSLEDFEGFLLSDGAGFVYRREGRPDPFVPFITQELVRAQRKGAEEELTGMRKFEPGQLNLVAIVFTEKGPLAMVQDSTGKGYTIRKGTKIGRSGEVVDIVANKVIINEVAYTMTKKKRYRSVEMVLKKEGEKK